VLRRAVTHPHHFDRPPRGWRDTFRSQPPNPLRHHARTKVSRLRRAARVRRSFTTGSWDGYARPATASAGTSMPRRAARHADKHEGQEDAPGGANRKCAVWRHFSSPRTRAPVRLPMRLVNRELRADTSSDAQPLPGCRPVT
jgi:hypothetical protein